MKHKGINYPADYDNDRSLRREHRAGVILVWVLVALIAVSMTVCAALSARGLKMLPKYCAGEQIIGELLPDITAEPKNGTVPNPESGASFDPGALPEPGPTAEPVPTVEPNPGFMDHAAQPFSQSFDSVPDVIEGCRSYTDHLRRGNARTA